MNDRSHFSLHLKGFPFWHLKCSYTLYWQVKVLRQWRQLCLSLFFNILIYEGEDYCFAILCPPSTDSTSFSVGGFLLLRITYVAATNPFPSSHNTSLTEWLFYASTASSLEKSSPEIPNINSNLLLLRKLRKLQNKFQ